MSIIKDLVVGGSMDKRLVAKYGVMLYKYRCSKGHLNSPSAKICWKCGEKLV